MEKVYPEPRVGQGSDPSSERDERQPLRLLDVGPVEEAPTATEAALLDAGPVEEETAATEAASSLLRERGAPPLRPTSHYPLQPREGESEEGAIFRSLMRRAARAV